MNDDRVEPEFLDMEQSVLGAMLIERRAIDEASKVLSSTDFKRDAYGAIFSAIRDVHATGAEADLLSVQQRLTELGILEACGGIGTLVGCMDRVPSATNIAYYCGKVKEASARRRILLATAHHRERVYDGDPIASIVGDMCDELKAISLSVSVEDDEYDVRKSVDEWYDAKEARALSEAMLGMPTTITGLDECTQGIVPGQYWVLKGPSSGGKTALGVQIADWISSRGQRVLIDSHEMSRDDVYDRISANRGSVDLRQLRKAALTAEEWRRVGEVCAELSQRDELRIRRPKDAKVSSTIAAAQRIDGLKLLVVDYLQRLESDNPSDTEVVKTQNISRQLANYAQQSGVAVIALCQQNDDGKTAWARSIFNDADVLIGIVPGTADPGEPTVDCLLNIEKQRNGPVGSVPVRFHRAYTRFAMRDDR